MYDEAELTERFKNLNYRISQLEKTREALVFGNFVLWGLVIGLAIRTGALF